MGADGEKPSRGRGRPKKEPEKGLRRNYGFRMSDQTRDRVMEAASASGRSMSEEIELRIERSFADADIAAMAASIAVGRAFDAVFGTGDAKKLLTAFATAIRMVEIQTGKSISEDEYTKITASKVMWLIYRSWYGPVSEEKYSKDDQNKMFDLAQKTATIACGIVDLQYSGKLSAWMKEHLPDIPE